MKRPAIHTAGRLQFLKQPAPNAHNRIPPVEATVALKLNQTSSPENGLFSFSGVLFWFFFAQAKKNSYPITQRKKINAYTKIKMRESR